MTEPLSPEDEASVRHWIAQHEFMTPTLGHGVAALEVLPKLLATLDVERALRVAAETAAWSWANAPQPAPEARQQERDRIAAEVEALVEAQHAHSVEFAGHVNRDAVLRIVKGEQP